MNIKDRIKQVRNVLGITQSKFANRIAVSSSYISEVENGVKEINERAIRLIVAEYNVNEDWLRNGNEPMFNEDLSAILSEVMGIFKSLDKPFQDGALKMLATWAEVNQATKSPSK